MLNLIQHLQLDSDESQNLVVGVRLRVEPAMTEVDCHAELDSASGC